MLRNYKMHSIRVEYDYYHAGENCMGQDYVNSGHTNEVVKVIAPSKAMADVYMTKRYQEHSGSKSRTNVKFEYIGAEDCPVILINFPY